MKKAFTLIELLIVVAIIAILAAIAVPNFLEAQTRAKVARVKNDLRTMATAIESYQIDHNKPPPQSKSGAAGVGVFAPVIDPSYPTVKGTGTLTFAITTPISYLTSFMFMDPFVINSPLTRIDERLYTYQAYQWKWPESGAGGSTASTAPTIAEGGNQGLTGLQWQELYGRWMTMSIGPDRNFYNQTAQSSPAPITLPYDATNGTVSPGNIHRSQKESEQKTWILFP